MKPILVAMTLLAAGPAFAADMSQWPAWKTRNRAALAEVVAGFEAGDAPAADKAQAKRAAEELLALFDAMTARIETAAATARQTLLARARDGQMPAGESVRDIMRVSRLREAHLAYWEGTLVREVICRFAESLDRAKPLLPHMVAGPEYVETVRAFPVDTKALGAEIDLSQAVDVLAEDAASGERHRH